MHPCIPKKYTIFVGSTLLLIVKTKCFIFLTLLTVAILFQNCTTKKNTFVHRGYHNLTARFNGYYWSNEAINDGIYKIEKNNKENYDKVLPVYILPTNENAKTTFPEFDKAIKKASLVIQRHTIRDKSDNEIASAGKWIDNNWINIGISHFYKREFFSGIEALDYASRTYVKSKDKYEALLWQAKSFNEIGAVSQSEPIIGLLANDKKLPNKIKSALYAVKADYFIKRGLNKEAVQVLTDAVNQKNLFTGIKKKERARYAFIAAQLFEQERNYKRARLFYEKAIDLKPEYDMVFYATIKLSRLVDVKNANVEKVKAKLLKMTKDYKNIDYLDVIYYTLGEIEEKEKNIEQAIVYYKKSAKSSVTNPNQKALSYLRLGEIHFDKTDYTASGSYYDSTVAVLPKDHPDYSNISNRRKTLEVLVGYIKTIQHEDSVQKIARMSEADRNKAIDNMIARFEDEEQRKKDELENAQAQNQLASNTNTSAASNNLNTGGGAWYFYNQTTLSFGIADFAKKWGNRKLEDNWRRSQKSLVAEADNPNDINANNPKNNANAKNKDPRKTREFYLKRMPLSDSLMKVSDNKIIEADYLLGATYKEDLNNNKKSIAAFEDLNKRYAENKYKLNCYYQLYRIYLADKNQPQSDFYKDKLLSEYPNSEYSKLIKNPKYAEERNASRSEVEKFYVSTYDNYSSENYTGALQQCVDANDKYGRTEFTPKFEFIHSMCLGKLHGIDTLESAMKQFTILYPKSELTPKANEILLAIKKQRNPSMFSGTGINNPNKMSADTFKINFDIEHIVLIIAPDDPKIVNPFKQAIDEFNRQYYSNKEFSITDNLFASAQQMILVKSFPNAQESHGYLDNLKNDSKIYSGSIKKEVFSFYIISTENLPLFYKKANGNSYRLFFDEAYKTIFNNPNK